MVNLNKEEALKKLEEIKKIPLDNSDMCFPLPNEISTQLDKLKENPSIRKEDIEKLIKELFTLITENVGDGQFISEESIELSAENPVSLFPSAPMFSVDLSDETKLKLKLCNKLLENSKRLLAASHELSKLVWEAKELTTDLLMREFDPKTRFSDPNEIDFTNRVARFRRRVINYKILFSETASIQLELDQLNEKINELE